MKLWILRPRATPQSPDAFVSVCTQRAVFNYKVNDMLQTVWKKTTILDWSQQLLNVSNRTYGSDNTSVGSHCSSVPARNMS